MKTIKILTNIQLDKQMINNITSRHQIQNPDLPHKQKIQTIRIIHSQSQSLVLNQVNTFLIHEHKRIVGNKIQNL